MPQTCGRGLSVLGAGKLLAAGALVLTVMVEAGRHVSQYI